MRTHLVVGGAEVDGDEGEPDDAGRVHGEADVLGLVEVFRDLARLECVQRAEGDEQEVEEQRRHERLGRLGARQHYRVQLRVQLVRVGRLNVDPHARHDHLNHHQRCGTQGQEIKNSRRKKKLHYRKTVFKRERLSQVHKADQTKGNVILSSLG